MEDTGIRRIRALKKHVSTTLTAHAAVTTLQDALRQVLHNSLDAGATKITVTVDVSALSLTVSDDGSGIHPDDLASAGRPGYSSKDQQGRSLGHKGEALAAIALVSNLSLVSKICSYNSSFYTRIRSGVRVIQPRMLDQEEDTDQRPIRSVSGTTVKVKQLFLNTPPRLEQVRKIPEHKTLSDIRECLMECLVVNPNVSVTAYKISEGGTSSQLIANVTGSPDTCTSWKKALNSIYGISLHERSFYTKTCYEGVKMICLAGSLPVMSKNYQFISLNGPFVHDDQARQLINSGLERAGFGKTEEEVLVSSMSRSDTSPKKGKVPTRSATVVGNTIGRHAVFIMKFEITGSITSSMIDNGLSIVGNNAVKTQISLWLHNFVHMLQGHPTKSSHIEPVTTATSTPHITSTTPNKITKAASSLVINSNMRLGALREKELNGLIPQPAASTNSKSRTSSQTETMKNIIKRRRLLPEFETHPCLPSYEHGELTLDKLRQVSIQRDLLTDCTVISQVDTKFILLKANNPAGSLYLVDQHACDERIQVEGLLRSLHDDAIKSSKELAVPNKGKPVTLHMDSTTLPLLVQYKAQLSTWGIKFIIENTGCVRLTHLPEIMHVKVDGDNTFIGKCIIQYLHDLENNVKLKQVPEDWWLSIQAIPQILIQLINSKACRSAIMFGDRLSRSECQLLVRDLAQCKQPFQCAHGRPSIVPLCDLSEHLNYSIDSD